MNHTLNFGTSNYQFYITDKNFSQYTGDSNFWTDDAIRCRLAVGEGILGVGLECYGPFKGELILLDKKRDDVEYSHYDHIVEGGLNIKSGILEVLDCPNSNVELEVKVSPGSYGVRIYSLNLDSVEGDAGNDYYIIEIWPGINTERKVLKQYK
ncbi:MAG: hypothetical protein ACTHLE_24420 [Agriterribacter sp.]